MHILIGAIVGATFAVVLVAGAALITGKKPTLKNLALAALGGAVAGAVTSATLGAGGVVGAGAVKQVVAFSAGGAAGGVSERVADNGLEDRALHDGVVKSAGVGAAAGLISLGTMRGTRHVIGKVSPRLLMSPGGNMNFGMRLLTAPVPGTGAGLVRLHEERKKRNKSPPEAQTSAREKTTPAGEHGLSGALGNIK